MKLIPIADHLRSKVEIKLMGCVTHLNRLRTPAVVTLGELKLMMLAEQKPSESPLRVDADELCLKINISRRTLDRWVAKRRIPFEKIGRVLRFDLAAVDSALQKFRRNAAGY